MIFLLMFVFRMQCAFANLLQIWLLSSGEVHWRRVKQRGLWQWGGGRPGSRCIFFYCKQWTWSCHPKTSLLRTNLILLMPQVRRGRRRVILVRRLSTRSEWSAWEERPASPWYWRWQWLEESDRKCWSIVVDNWEVVTILLLLILVPLNDNNQEKISNMIVGTICGQYPRLYPKWLRRIQDLISSSILQQLITSIAKKDKCEDRSFCGQRSLLILRDMCW